VIQVFNDDEDRLQTLRQTAPSSRRPLPTEP
jgi:hypothetical protein